MKGDSYIATAGAFGDALSVAEGAEVGDLVRQGAVGWAVSVAVL